MSRVRDHWSIGEVLALLQDEFPEVTISKIRFLESQGLIDPERTSSGYRKFSDTDYDRLYWILEQQRDHYLPLRVIRDRLEEGQEIGPAPRRSDMSMGEALDDLDGDDGPEPEPEEEGPTGSSAVGTTELKASTDPEAGLDSSFADALAGITGGVAATDPDAVHPVKDESANALASVMGATEGSDKEATPEVEPDQADEPVAEEATAERVAAEGDDASAADDTAHADDASAVDDTADAEGSAPGAPAKKPAPRLLGTRSEPPRPVTKTTAEALAPAPRPSLPGSSVALTGEELAEQSGTTPGMIGELQKYGMISPRQVGSALLFDSTALTIARLAVQFGRYGLEPRHLKTFRLGAEREVALLTQSIGPTLRANNPETRRRSYDTLQDLAELSASLRSIIVRDLVADLEPDG